MYDFLISLDIVTLNEMTEEVIVWCYEYTNTIIMSDCCSITISGTCHRQGHKLNTYNSAWSMISQIQCYIKKKWQTIIVIEALGFVLKQRKTF